MGCGTSSKIVNDPRLKEELQLGVQLKCASITRSVAEFQEQKPFARILLGNALRKSRPAEGNTPLDGDIPNSFHKCLGE